MVKRRSKRLGGGELEALVMGILWDVEDWLTPGEVGTRLEAVHPVAYTSVMTILVRLWNKGHLERRSEGRAYAYRPLDSREERAAQQMQDLLASSGDHLAALTHFLDGMSRRDRTQLRKLLQGGHRT